jgi:hypothetical protein
MENLTLYYSLEDKRFTKGTPDDNTLMVCIDMEVSFSSQKEEGHGSHDVSFMETDILSIYRLDTIGGIMSQVEIKETLAALVLLDPNDYL